MTAKMDGQLKESRPLQKPGSIGMDFNLNEVNWLQFLKQKENLTY